MVGTTTDTAAIAPLAHERRRTVLRRLREYGMPMTLADLADEVVGSENDEPVPELSGEEVTRVAARLHHVDLPKLAEAGFLTYDLQTNVVRLSERGETFDYETIPMAMP
ncbi:hypothetical protein ACFQDG_15485 [Natronoarchaeum mannanilyticum]|uniref:DUF7344 domain-containing protein n=1 Tax=Natronoarchaeum mannanilyticum TaxID=926360 RepID=A0AAV3T976_9EURY